MHILNTFGLPLPEIVVVKTAEEIERVRSAGLPYIVQPGKMGDEAIVKALLWPIIADRFPYVKLANPKHDVELVMPDVVRLGLGECVREGGSFGNGEANEFAMVSEGDMVVNRGDYRYSTGNVVDGVEHEDSYRPVDLLKMQERGYLTVDTTELLDAGLLPKFLMDIGESIRANLSSYQWNDCWNRKLGAMLGEYTMVDERPNLIVLDISGSIPRGVSYTMVQLIETLREQANADLIVNSGSSQWWPHDEPIDLDEIEKILGGGNEATQFYRILDEHVLGRKWGTLIGFGDCDAPAYGWKFQKAKDNGVVPADDKFASTEFGKVISYHVSSDVQLAGYISWAKLCKFDEIENKPASWVKFLRRTSR